MAVLLDRTVFSAAGRDARAHLQSMLTQDLDAVPDGGGAYALLLTPKARVIADLEVFSADGRWLLALPPLAAGTAVHTLELARFRKKVEFAATSHAVVWDAGDEGLARLDTPAGPLTLVEHAPPVAGSVEGWQQAAVEAGLPRYGVDFDGDSMPAEAGLEGRAISFTKGCYPGQEPVARLHYRGHANRLLRGLRYTGPPPDPGTSVELEGRQVGRTGSTAVSARFGPIGLAIVRRELEPGTQVDAGGPATVAALPFADS